MQKQEDSSIAILLKWSVAIIYSAFSPFSSLTLSSVVSSSGSSSSSDLSSFKSAVKALLHQRSPSLCQFYDLPDKDSHDQDSPEQVDTQQQEDGDKDLNSHPGRHVLPIGEWLEYLSILLGDEEPFVPYTD